MPLGMSLPSPDRHEKTMSPTQNDPHMIKILEQLRRNFASTFELWKRDQSGQWTLEIVQDFGTTPSRDLNITQLLSNAPSFSETTFLDCPHTGKRLVVVPMVNPEQPTVAVALYKVNEDFLARQLALGAFTNVETQRKVSYQNECLEDFVRQVSENFEEMIWLRRFASQMVVSEQMELTDMAHTNLDALRRIMDAETVAMLIAHRAHSPSDEPETTYECILSGRQFDQQVIWNVIQQYRNEADIQPFVKNDIHPGEVGESIHSFVIVSIAVSDQNFGWMIAINKQASPVRQMEMLNQTPVSENEFGTQEASLMEAAAAIMAVHASNTELFRQKDQLLIGTIRAMMHVIEAKDPYTRGHSDRVARIARRLSRQLRLSSRECDQIYISGLVHDIGKIGVPDQILNKPGRLTEEEFDEIRKHPRRGFKILNALEQIENVLPGVLYHHESIDGTGYPERLKGDQIPLVAKILAVSDAYDAMTSDRPYRKGMEMTKAEEILMSGAGQQWDLHVVKAFFAALDDIHEICDSTDKRVDTAPTQSDSDHHSPLESPTNFGDTLSKAVISSSRN